MKKILTIATGLFAVTLSPLWAQNYNDAGTEYSTAKTETWTEDEANELVHYPSAFACLIKNSRGDVIPNGNWEGLLDEAACGLDNTDVDQAGVQYGRGIFSSSRASNSSPQNVTVWFESLSGLKFLADTSVSSAPTDANPVGEWTFSFYQAGLDGTVAPADSTDYGYVEVAENNGAVTITTANLYNEGYGDEEDAAIVKYNADGTVSFVGFRIEEDYEEAVAGKASDDYYYRVKFQGDGVDVAGLRSGSASALTALLNIADPPDACFARENPWKSVNRYELFTESGARVNLDGGFGFITGSSGQGTRGYVGNWGVWMEDRENSPFTPSSTSLDIRAEIPGENGVRLRSLEWAPGKLYKLNTVVEDLADGTVFRTWAEISPGNWGEVEATYDATADEFILTDEGSPVGILDAAAAASAPWRVRFWSPEKRTEVMWNYAGADSAEKDKIIFDLRTKMSKNADILENGIALASRYNGAPKAALPISVANSSRENYSTGTAGDSYFFSGLNPGTNIEPRTLYIDSDGVSGLTADDKPVRFDFLATHSVAGQAYQSYSDSFDSGEYTGQWPYSSFELYDPNDSDCADPSSSDCDRYEWSFGAMRWDHSIIATENDTLVNIDEPIQFEYTHAAANERNGNQIFEYVTNDDYNPAAHTFNNSKFVVDNTTFANRVFYLEFDGTNLHGLPNVVIGNDDYGHWVSLINLLDGTQLTATDSGGTTYRVKAVEVSETLNEVSYDICENEGITFEDPSGLGIGLGDVPETSQENIPTSLWSDKPDESTLLCTVTHGDATDCTE
ncbi:MAG: Uncharacterised protein [Alphaproteobacteria bacterium]|nr:MAG: Uncharacterised protein [Alphaproteobacteria bacterium]